MIREILEHAKWAPSGDNEQNWRFEILSQDELVIHGYHTAEELWLDSTGKASLISLGALVENIAIAASAKGYTIAVSQRDNPYTIKVTFTLEEDLEIDPLSDLIVPRQTNRFPFSRKQISPEIRNALAESLPKGTEVKFIDERHQMGRLQMIAAKIRILHPDGYKDLKPIIDWNTEQSTSKLPAKALGLDPLSLAILKWSLQSQQRYDRLRFLPGYSFLPRLQLEYIPSLLCGTHFLLFQQESKWLEGGRAMQRFWLTAAKYQLCLQPSYTHIALTDFFHQPDRLTEDEFLQHLLKKVEKLQLPLLEGFGRSYLLFGGRIGFGKNPKPRSIRKSLDDLMH